MTAVCPTCGDDPRGGDFGHGGLCPDPFHSHNEQARETVSGRVRQRFTEAEAKLRAAGDLDGATWAHRQAREMEKLVHSALTELSGRLADQYVERLEEHMGES